MRDTSTRVSRLLYPRLRGGNLRQLRSPAAALAQAQREIAADLPDGVNTRGQVLCCLFDDSDGAEKRVGYLWYKPDEEMRSAFICDFYIYPAFQGQGLGKQAMAAFEHALKSQDQPN
jgi:ribosomal protein S18 acetylase RimI-like enzyme